MSRTRLLCLLAVALLVACATSAVDLVPGASVTEIQAQLGKPTATYELPNGGKRLEFAYVRGPRTYMVDVDAAGRLVDSTQVLNENNFMNIVADMPREKVLMTVGHPSQVYRGGRQGGEIWSYAYQNVQCLWFQVSMGADGRTIGGGTTSMMPVCMSAP
jgi:hypothetical protein